MSSTFSAGSSQAAAGHDLGPVRFPALRKLSGSLAGSVALIVAASLFVAALAHLSFPLPFTPVPLTLSDFAVLIVGFTLGPRLGFAALALYLAEGAAGLPVFSPAGPGGLAQFHITGGYLLAYPFAAALTGFLARAVAALPAYAACFLAALAGSVLIMTSGAAWLGLYTHHDLAFTFKLAVLPFLPGQVVKIACAAGISTAIDRRRFN